MMDNKGNISIEIGIILIMIVLISGIVLSLSEMSTQKVMKETQKEEIEMMVNTAADSMINNPGNPDNWENNQRGTPGLAIINEEGQVIPNSISYAKFCALAKNYEKLITQKLFNSKIKTSMELIPMKSSISSVKIGYDDDVKNIYSANRIVKCDFYKKYVLKDFEIPGKCNHNHDKNSHSCNYFKVFKGNLRESDYYLLIDEDEKNDLNYIVDTTRVVKQRYWEPLESEKIYLNEKIDFYEDSSAIVFIHFDKPNAKAVLISVPKNFDEDNLKYDYFKTTECEFILRAWH